MSIITPELSAKLIEPWLKVKSAFQNFQHSPLNFLLAIHEFNQVKNEYFFTLRQSCTPENMREIIEHLSTREILSINKEQLLRLEQFNIALTEFYNRQARTGDGRLLGEKNVLATEFVTIGLTIARIFSVSATIGNIPREEFPRDFVEKDLAIAASLLYQLENNHLKLLDELVDLLKARQLLLYAHSMHGRDTDKSIQTLLALVKQRMREIFDEIWTGANKCYFIYAFDTNPTYRRNLLYCHRQFVCIEGRKRQAHHFEKSVEFKLRSAKHETLALIHSKQRFMQSTGNKALLIQVARKTHTAQSLTEINQLLDEIKTKYRPRDQICYLVYRIKCFFAINTSQTNTNTYKTAVAIQRKYLS